VRGPLALICCVCLLGGLSACGSDDNKGSKVRKTPGHATAPATKTGATTPPPATTPEAPAGPPVCRKVSAPPSRPAAHLPRPRLKLSPKRAWSAVVDTNCGRFTIGLDVKDSPKTTASFAHLARRGFFDRTLVFRVVPGFIIQAGDPTATTEGDPGYTIVEPPPPGTRYTHGVVAMGKTEIEDPGTSGSQFYVVTGEDAQLPPDYALLGKVSAGQDVVDLIGALPTDQGNPDPVLRERPAQPVVIRSVRIVSRPR
jgi:peptidyl-prolyl cis-trans isomerase B (cyclophilin B)